jgi:hypothetical protein
MYARLLDPTRLLIDRDPIEQGIKGRVINLDMSAAHLMRLRNAKQAAIEPFAEQTEA